MVSEQHLYHPQDMQLNDDQLPLKNLGFDAEFCHVRLPTASSSLAAFVFVKPVIFFFVCVCVNAGRHVSGVLNAE